MTREKVPTYAGSKMPDPQPSELTPCLGGYDRPMVSLVIPTKDEAGNIRELITRLQGVLTGIDTEIIFVDDSSDGTPQVISDVCYGRPIPLCLIHRSPGHRGGGLGGAVVEGIRSAKGNWVCVMDADLQHPPELIPELLESARIQGADIIVASRYADPSEGTGLEGVRLAYSKLCTLAARLLFFRRLQKITDPISGYFLVRREAIDPGCLNPSGFKILLEFLGRFPDLKVYEVPFQLGIRVSGQSKATIYEGLRYLSYLLTLRVTATAQRLSGLQSRSQKGKL